MILPRRYFVLLLVFLPLLMLLPWRWFLSVRPVITATNGNPESDSLEKNEKAEIEILGHCYQVITGDESLDGTQAAMDFFSDFLRVLPQASVKELNLGLQVLEKVLPLGSGYLKTFSHLNSAEKTQVLSNLQNGPTTLYPLFVGIKELAYLAYYQRPKNWTPFDYPGPMVAANALERDDADYNQAYDQLLAPPGLHSESKPRVSP